MQWLADRKTSLFYGAAFVEMPSIAIAKDAVKRANKGVSFALLVQLHHLPCVVQYH